MESQYDSCVLIVADRVVARADAGALDAEFALFDPEAIELRTTEPGAVREAGYRTTVAEARERLAELGLTIDLVRATAEAMLPMLASAYARGPVVRRAVQELGAAELFEGRVYLSSARVYEGQWLDLAAFTFDLGDPRAARALQAMHLAALLNEVPDDAEVYVSTLALTRTQRPGVRTYRRVSFEDVDQWPSRLRHFAERMNPGSVREGGPTRVEMLDWLRARGERATGGARERMNRIERAIAAGSPRPPPPKGPLSDPVAWAIEAQLDAGDAEAAVRRIDAMEHERGSIPCVVYLRSRASLLLKREDPRLIAERVSMLAAKASFDELELLAAQAWAAAGNMSRALPYARVLAGNPRAHHELRNRARQLVERGESQRPSVPTRRRDTPTPTISAVPLGSLGKRTTLQGPGFTDPPTSGARERRAPSTAARPPRHDSPLPLVLQPTRSSPPPTPRVSAPAAFLAETLSDEPKDPRQIVTLPPPPSPVPGSARAASSAAEELDDPATPIPDLAPENDTSLEESGEHRTLNKGVSRPAFRAVSTNATPPHLAIGRVDLAERLQDPTAPPSLADARVRASHEARMRCTALSRELGRLYRVQCNIELRTDVTSLEAMQAELLARYQGVTIRTAAATLDIQRHGAFLSEIIARTLRATWLDVGNEELGHWTMFVPPDTRVWPFARVLRFVTMGSRERDLVAYFLELHARSY